MKRFNIWNKLIELLQTSVLIQSLITLALIITVIILWLTAREVPQQLYDFIFVVLGFYFGTKATYNVMKGRLK